MARGLRIPVGPGPLGGLALVDGDVQASKVISLALGQLDNRNAFQQDIGLGSEDFVFNVQSAETRAAIRRRVVQVFADFEDRNLFRLVPNSIAFEEDSAAQELILELRYINLESDEEETFRESFGQGA